MNKILTIIIPTYNMERYLHRCLSSLLIGARQGEMEVLVVNDGSKDASLGIAREYEQNYPETFRVIDKENGNYGSCINRALAEATGKYVKVLDADDNYSTEHLSILIEALHEHDVDMFLTDYTIVDEANVQTGSFLRNNVPEGRVMEAEELFALTAGTIIRMHEITYRTENLRSMGYRQTEGISYTDMEWTFAPLSMVKTVYCLHIPVYRYLVGRAGQTVDPTVAARSQGQAEKTMFVQVETFSRMKNLAPNLRRHLLGHITMNMKLTYRAYLVTAYRQLGRDGLMALDERLKATCRELYDIMDQQYVHPRIPLRFIREWRRNGCRETLALKFYRSMVFPILRKLNIG